MGREVVGGFVRYASVEITGEITVVGGYHVLFEDVDRNNMMPQPKPCDIFGLWPVFVVKARHSK